MIHAYRQKIKMAPPDHAKQNVTHKKWDSIQLFNCSPALDEPYFAKEESGRHVRLAFSRDDNAGILVIETIFR